MEDKEKKEIQKLYSSYDKEVRAYMNDLLDSLIIQYGKIESTWKSSFRLIALNYDIIKKCEKDIQKYGIQKLDDRGRLSKNPSISVLNATQGHLYKLLSSFALNPMAKSKLKDTDTDNDLENLLND